MHAPKHESPFCKSRTCHVTMFMRSMTASRALFKQTEWAKSLSRTKFLHLPRGNTDQIPNRTVLEIGDSHVQSIDKGKAKPKDIYLHIYTCICIYMYIYVYIYIYILMCVSKLRK